MRSWVSLLFFLPYLSLSSETDITDLRNSVESLENELNSCVSEQETLMAHCDSVLNDLQDLTGCDQETETTEIDAQVASWQNAVDNGGLDCSFVPDEFRETVCPMPSMIPTFQPTGDCVDIFPTDQCEQIRDLNLCNAISEVNPQNSSCALTCGACCPVIQFSNCLDEYVGHCLSCCSDDPVDCLSKLPTEDISFCCSQYVKSEIPNICEQLVVENSLYDGTYSLAGTRNGRSFWKNGDVEIYFSEDLDLGARWLFVSDLTTYYLVLSDLMRPPDGESWIHSSSSSTVISMKCSVISASPTRTPSSPPSPPPVPQPSKAPFGLSDYGDIPTCCRLSAASPRGTVTLIQDQDRMKNGQVYWKSSDSVSFVEIYWSQGLFGNRWILSGLADFGYYGFTPLYHDFIGSNTWEYHDYSLGFDNIIPMQETVSITCTSERCDNTYDELCDLCSTTCSN